MRYRIQIGHPTSDSESYMFSVSVQEEGRHLMVGHKTVHDAIDSKQSHIGSRVSRVIYDLQNLNIGNDTFIASPLGCYNTWQSSFIFALEGLFKIPLLVEARHSVSIQVDDPIWLRVISRYLKSVHIKCAVSRLDSLKSLFSRVMLTTRHAKRGMLATLSYFYNYKPLNLNIKKSLSSYRRIIFTTWLGDSAENFEKDKVDPFFGKLTSEVLSETRDALLFAHVGKLDKEAYGRLKRLADTSHVRSYVNSISIFDYIRVVSEVMFASVRVGASYSYLKRAIKCDLNNTKWTQCAHALFIRQVVSRFMNANPDGQILYMFEGNCWERGIYLAKRMAASRNKVFAYQHTSMSQAFRKAGRAPLHDPDRILCTGKIPTNLMTSIFNFSKEQALPVCSLRLDLSAVKPLKHRLSTEIKTILVLLQGSPYDLSLLSKAAGFNSNCEFLVRAHPLAPIDPSILPVHFRLSQSRALQDDVAVCDMAIYHGTTAAIEVALLGIPCVYIDLNTMDSYDPLFFKIESPLIRQASNQISFEQCLNAYKDIDCELTKLIDDLRQTFLLYFTPPSHDGVKMMVSKMERIV
jgi:hypothetical protein